jgi:glucose-6-phosphate 1-epimerase
VTYRLILREKELHFNLGVLNTGVETFSFTILLHTYFKVPDVRKCQISGLRGCAYSDKVRDGVTFLEERDVVTVSEFTDRVYADTPSEHVITNVVSGRKMRMVKNNLPDTVVWNPWAESARALADFGDEEYPNMICVEAGRVSSPIHLNPGTVFEASQILQVCMITEDALSFTLKAKKLFFSLSFAF